MATVERAGAVEVPAHSKCDLEARAEPVAEFHEIAVLAATPEREPRVAIRVSDTESSEPTPFVPMIRAVAVDPSGVIWVERNTFPEEPKRVDIFTSEGIYAGTLVGLSAPLGFPGRGLVVIALADSEEVLSRVVDRDQ